MSAPTALREKRPTSPSRAWTVADLHRKFGPIAFDRIRQDPPPGRGTVADVERIHDEEDRLYELVDGILLEKTMGLEESRVAMRIGRFIGNFADDHGRGIVAGEAGMLQLDIDLVRIPDVSFISWDRLPGGVIPDEAVPLLIPDLVVEVLSRGNTRKEMDDKLREYFEKGVRLVWYVRPRLRAVDVYTSPDRFTRLTASMTLEGGDVLPGFSVTVGELFAVPGPPAAGKPKKPEGPPSGKKGGRRGR